ncbi:hypothetical protein EDD22DRAFT_970813 [Suillus occidentalis]|nr:hypothetical protein EDD22DRAFT_970813 [Suillus occidentalis]
MIYFSSFSSCLVKEARKHCTNISKRVAVQFAAVHWDDWGDAFECNGDQWEPESDTPPQSVILLAASVCKRWQSFLTQTPSMWTELQISFKEGAAALEHARKFVQNSGTSLLNITLLWDDPSWIVPISWNDTDIITASSIRSGLKPASRGEIIAGVHLVFVIKELYAHVHRWREFTLRTTSFSHTCQALSSMSLPSVHPACNLEKLHLRFIQNPRHADHLMDEPSLFPGSVPPIRDLLLFGISWTWPSSHMFSSHLSDLRIHYDDYCTDIPEDTETWPNRAKNISQLLGALVNLRTLTLELELPSYDDTMSIELPNLHSLAIKSRSMASWTANFLHSVKMPNLRILTLCVASLEKENSVEGVFEELATLTDPDEYDPDEDDSSSYLLELDELHLINFSHQERPGFIHRLFVQMAVVETLTLGPRADGDNVALAMALLPTPYGLPDLAFPNLRTLVAFDVPKNVMRHIVLERMSLAGPLEELYYQYGQQDESVQDDWQHGVEKYHRIDYMDCERVQDFVDKRWSYLT